MKKNKLYLNILILIICLLPLKNVNAEMCRFKPVTTMMKYCDKNKTNCTPFMLPGNQGGDGIYNTVVLKETCTGDGWTIKETSSGSLCVKGDCSNEEVEQASYETNGECSTVNNASYANRYDQILLADAESSLECMAYGYYSYVDGPLIVKVKANESHKLNLSQAKSLVSDKVGSMFSPGTGVYFEVKYDGSIDWETLVDCPKQYYYNWEAVGSWTETTCSKSPSQAYLDHQEPKKSKSRAKKEEKHCEAMSDCGLSKEEAKRLADIYNKVWHPHYASASYLEETWTYTGSYRGDYPCECVPQYRVEKYKGDDGKWYAEDVYCGCEYPCERLYCDTYTVTSYDCVQHEGKRHSACDKVETSVTPATIKSETTVTTKTTTGDDIQTLGPMVPDENNNPKTVKALSGNIRNFYTFTVPKAYINIKNTEIKYVWNSNYKNYSLTGKFNQKQFSEYNNKLWQNIRDGYYIPVNAIPESNAKVVFEAGTGTNNTMGYTIKVKVDSPYIYGEVFPINKSPKKISSILTSNFGDESCGFGVTIPGCPKHDCGPSGGTCNPKTDEYKCCRNSAYLKKHPEYYKNCGMKDFYVYRQITLGDPFPSRNAGNNWKEWYESITNKAKLKDSYNKLEYSIDLTNDLISKIRGYNNKSGNEYTSWTQINNDGSSNFLKDGTSSSISIGNNFKSNSTYYNLGCGPNNQEFEWCTQENTSN